jgi:S-adenosylmethionine-dependent methyltransferase
MVVPQISAAAGARPVRACIVAIVTIASDDFVFGPGVTTWRAGLGKLRDAVRQDLVASQLAEHLPPTTAEGVAVLDVGCGQGTQAIRLARAGYQVQGIDVSEELLAVARAAAAAESDEVRQRLRFDRGDLLQLGSDVSGRFDVVCCHGVLMYLPSLGDALTALVAAARPGGLLSVLTRNRAGIAMRAGMSGQWPAALEAFDARYYRNRVGIDDVRADEPEEVRLWMERAGATRSAWYGVRLFTDHFGAAETTQDFAALLAAEAEAGRRDPYRTVAALTHTIAVRVTGSATRN